MSTRHPATRNGLRRAARWIGLLAVLLPGCIVVRTQPSARVFAGSADRPGPASTPEGSSRLPWPERFGAPPDGLQGVIVPLDWPYEAWNGVRLGREHHLRTGATEYEDASVLARHFDVDGGFQFQPEGPGSMIFLLDPRYRGPDAAPLPRPKPTDPSHVFKFVSGTPVERGIGPEAVQIERTWMTFSDPLPAGDQEARGIIVVVPGMLGTPKPIIDTMVGIFRARGWSVLRLLSHPSRFTEHATFEVDTADLTGTVARISDTLTGRAAEAAYAVEAGLDHVLGLRPELGELPTVLLGMSGGAMISPVIHARAPERFDAAVLIAGGSHFLSISVGSNYSRWVDAIAFDWEPDDPDTLGVPTDLALTALEIKYLDRARLDSYWLAPLMRDMPVLMLHGSKDKAVPAARGDELWRQLGRPERWVMPVGHEVLFLGLPLQAGRIESWITDQLSPPPQEPAS